MDNRHRTIAAKSIALTACPQQPQLLNRARLRLSPRQAAATACSRCSGLGLKNLEIPPKSREKTCEPPISVVTQKLEYSSTEDFFPGDDIWRSPPSLTESRKTLSSVNSHNISKAQVSSSSYLPPVKDPHPRWEIGLCRSSRPPPLNWRRAQILLRDGRRTVCQRSINRRLPVPITIL